MILFQTAKSGFRLLFQILAILFFTSNSLNAQALKFPPFTKWYQNPLGFTPLALHTGSGIIVPAVIVGSIYAFTKKDTSLRRRISYFTEFGASKTYFGPNVYMYQNNTGILFRARKYLGLGAEITTYVPMGNSNNAVGFGIRPFARFYLLNRSRFNLYFESGAGLIYFIDKFPQPSGFFNDFRTGTHLNGSPKYGIGADFKISDKVQVNLALKHIHISNGNNPSAEQNPGHDSNGLAIGLIYNP